MPGLLTRAFTMIAEVISPRHCEVCSQLNNSPARRHEFICNRCYDSIPFAPDPAVIINSISSMHHADDIMIDNAYCLFGIREDHNYMNLIYSLKYHGFSRVGFELGKELGQILKYYSVPAYDKILPVPIHKVRLRERGYNQSDFIARGVASVIGAEVSDKLVKRGIYTTTQTLLSAKKRKENVANAFSPWSSSVNIKGKSVLIVDDVLTTGSTINSIAIVLAEMGARRIDCATLAFAGT